MSDDKRTATQRIEDLERVVTMLYQTVGQHKGIIESLLPVKTDVGMLKDVLKLLNKKTEAIIQASDPVTGVTFKSVSDLIVKMNVEELQAQVADFLKNGYLVPATEVDKTSYVVCEEYNKDGSVANPRVQFRLDSQVETLLEAMKGKKVGDTVVFGDDKFDAKILEIYTVVDNPAKPEDAVAVPAAVEAAPAAEAAAPAEAPAAAAPAQLALPEEKPIDFALQFHGEKDPAAASN